MSGAPIPISHAGQPAYAERIRHPSGALNPGGEHNRSPRWFWILLGVVALVWFAWRMGWLGRIAGAGAAVVSAVKPIANPHGWV